MYTPHMSHEINLGGTIYISSRRAAEITGYSQDYIGQLARSGSIQAQRISGLWYVLESSLAAYKEKAEQYVPIPPQVTREMEKEAIVSFEGRDYISASRASEISGYNADYVTQMARDGKILARQSGNRWFIDRESLLVHKSEKDSLLAAVQSEAVGIRDIDEMRSMNATEDFPSSPHFRYIDEHVVDLIPAKETLRSTTPEFVQDQGTDSFLGEEETSIPIRVLETSERDSVNSFSAPQHSAVWRLALMFLIITIPALFGAVIVSIDLDFSGYRRMITLPDAVKNVIARDLVFVRPRSF